MNQANGAKATADAIVQRVGAKKMQRVLIGIATLGLLAVSAQAAEENLGPRPSECSGYGQPEYCKKWDQQGGGGTWQPGQPGAPGTQGAGTWQPGQPGQPGTPGTGQPGTGQPPVTGWTPDQVTCPKNTIWDVQAQRCLFKKADTPTTTTKRCPPGEVALLYGNKWVCKRAGQQAGGKCRPGWIWSSRRGECVPGFAGPSQGGSDYGCRPWERWSNGRQRCVPRGGGTDGGGGPYGGGGGTYGGGTWQGGGGKHGGGG